MFQVSSFNPIFLGIMSISQRSRRVKEVRVQVIFAKIFREAVKTNGEIIEQDPCANADISKQSSIQDQGPVSQRKVVRLVLRCRYVLF